MRRAMGVLTGVVVLTFAPGVGGAWAETKVTVTREENKPKTVEIKAGEEVRFINASGSLETTPSVLRREGGLQRQVRQARHVRLHGSCDGWQGAFAHWHDRREVRES
jgi:plastocyanin